MTDSLAAPVTEFRKTHPKGLWILFFSELWERFSFYGMRALLVLYMVSDALKYGETRAYGVYAAYGALVYASPILGGYLADKVMGTRRAVLLGGLLMALGHFAMAIETPVFFYGALALLCVGNGFFKPNISTTVGRLYAQGDGMRDRGFVIFYMGINIGAFLAPIICGFVGENYGWHYGFGLAGIGMVLGLVVFMRGQALLEGHGEPVDPKVCEKWIKPVWIGAFLLVPVLALMLFKYEVAAYILYGLFAIVTVMVLKFALDARDAAERDRIYLFLILGVFHMLFWALFEQAGSSLILYADYVTDRRVSLFDWTMPSSLTQAFNPFFIVVLAPLFNILWAQLEKKSLNPNIPRKFGFALVQLGFGYYVLKLAADSLAPAEVLVPLLFLFLCYMLHTMGELCLSPIGLSAVTKLAPVRATAFFMGAWFLTISAGHKVAGVIASFTGSAGKFKPEVDLKGRAGFSEEAGGFDTEAILALNAKVNSACETLKVEIPFKDVVTVEAGGDYTEERLELAVSKVQSKLESLIPRLNAEADLPAEVTELLNGSLGSKLDSLNLSAETSGDGMDAVVAKAGVLQKGMLEGFTEVYANCGIGSMLAGLLLIILAGPLNKLGHGVK